MQLVAPLSSRNQFGAFLTERGLTGQAVEVGTHRGMFARTLLKHWPGTLHCVDPWKNPPGYEVQAQYLEGSTGDRDADYRQAAHYLADFGDRVRLLRMTSAKAAGRFKGGSLDFAYLDGDHSFDAVRDDLSLWWPKIRPGGVLAGHDIICPGPPGRPDDWGRYIQPAVYTFAETVGVDVYLVVEECGLPWSMFMVKP